MSLIKKIGLYVLILSGTLILVYFITGILNESGIDSQRVGLTKTELNNSLSSIIIITVIVPIIEELMYRYGLKFSPNKSSFLVLGVLYTIYLFFQPSNLDWRNPLLLAMFFGIPIILFFTIKFIIKKNYNLVENIYRKNLKYIFIISVVSFAYSHFTLHLNYTDLANILLSPIILIPYIIAGILYGGLRLKFGFIAGIIAHITWNLSATLL
jgi:membrane protease YdiL (CAAX protease family)